MKIKKPFEEMDEDEYLFGKLTNDGDYNHQFFVEQHLPRQRRQKPPEKWVEVDLSVLEGSQDKPHKKGVINEQAASMEEVPSEAQSVENGQIRGKNTLFEEVNQTAETIPKKQYQTVKMTLRELFDHYYKTYAKMKWKARWSKMMKAFEPYISDERTRKEFLRTNFKRKRHNERARKLRLNRKMAVNGFNYFVTFTFSDEKMTAEQFQKKLKTYLRNNVNRLGWKYIGVWEGGDGEKRLHFHALMYIADDAMPGENYVETKYNVVTKHMETHTRNTAFNEKFGLSTVEAIIPATKMQAYHYITKYMNKGGVMMMSRNCPTFIKGWIKKRELIGPVNEEETYFFTAADAEMVMETGEIVKLDPDKLHEVLPMATTCN